MRRRTVTLPDDLDARRRQEAARRGVTVPELIGLAIESLHDPNRRRLHAGGAGASGRSDISERIESIVANEI